MKQFMLIAALVLFVGGGCMAVEQESKDDATSVVEDVAEVTDSNEMGEEEETEEENAMEKNTEVKKEEGGAMEVKNENTNTTSENTEEKIAADTTTNVSTDGSYAISDGVSTYIVKKEFLGKPKQDIIGSTSDVGGTIVIANDAVTVDATIQNTFSTRNSGRDGEVKKLLQGPITVKTSGATVTNAKALATGKSFEETINLDLTIAGVTKSIPFSISVVPNGDNLGVTGAASFNMETDFGITPPSILNVYKVNPSMTVLFKLFTSK